MSYHHQILGIPINAGKETIKRAYREKAKQYHPDVNPASSAKESFIRVHRAYKYLMDNYGKSYSNSKRQEARQTNTRQEATRAAREKATKVRAAKLAKMRYEKFRKEEEAFRNSSFTWLYKLMYSIAYLFQVTVALFIGSIPFFAAYSEGWFTFFLLAPIFFFGTFAMVQKATSWKREINQAFVGG